MEDERRKTLIAFKVSVSEREAIKRFANGRSVSAYVRNAVLNATRVDEAAHEAERARQDALDLLNEARDTLAQAKHDAIKTKEGAIALFERIMRLVPKEGE